MRYQNWIAKIQTTPRCLYREISTNPCCHKIILKFLQPEFEKPCSNFYLLTYIFTLDKLKCHGQWKILINFLFRTGLSKIYRNSSGNSTESLCLKNQPEISFIEKEYAHEVWTSLQSILLWSYLCDFLFLKGYVSIRAPLTAYIIINGSVN